jgi:hypothetical protein
LKGKTHALCRGLSRVMIKGKNITYAKKMKTKSSGCDKGLSWKMSL